ncbi:hypothetical protein LTR15_005146 [Elasticomyces elasticus]|nr:hypothetical protein LTR15_005146 [Elasticomyces elasticus]
MSSLRNGPLAPGIAFITGGARGLGNAIAVSFARDGAKGVALVDIQDEATFKEGKEAVEKYGTKVICITADVTDESQVERAVAEAVKEFGRIDYAANFAGISGPLTPVIDTDTALWRKVLEVNTVGVWLSMKHELKQMVTQDSIDVESGRVSQRGSIVNCASVNSIQSGAGSSGYTASKHAVLGMTKACALEARTKDVRVNCVSPGFLRTKLLEEEFKKAIGSEMLGAADNDAAWGGFEARQGRKASFDEVGDVVVLLSTPRMSLVVGHNLVIDGEHRQVDIRQYRMYPPSMQGPARSRNETVDTSKRFSELYFGYASNLSPSSMKGRCPDSIFCGLARLDGWKWQINETQYGNIVPSTADSVYGALFFLSPRDEAGLDESEGVPWLYDKETLEVERIGADGKGLGQRVQVMTYVDEPRTGEGKIMPDYVVWISKAIRDATPYGLPGDYVEKYIKPYLPEVSKEDEEREIQMVRVMAPRSRPVAAG